MNGEQTSDKSGAEDCCLFFHNRFKISPTLKTSSNELYNGTGAMRMTFGSRQSTITLDSFRRLKISLPFDVATKDNWHPRSELFCGVTIFNARLGFSELKFSIMNSRNPVSISLFFRRFSIPASSK